MLVDCAGFVKGKNDVSIPETSFVRKRTVPQLPSQGSVRTDERNPPSPLAYKPHERRTIPHDMYKSFAITPQNS